ncbi:MAG: type III-A CRISPR-associated protein Csm2 [Chlorobiaceae bacterium]|nr:type III-A CRISPR-associated protein Csm2 [Chlorobiaceae bacterium]
MADFISVFGPIPDLNAKMEEIKRRLRAIETFSSDSQQASQVRDQFPEYAAAIAKKIGTKITSTQLRRFYTYVKSIEMANRHYNPTSREIKDKFKLRFILPKIAGTGEKERKSLHGLYEILSVCLLDGSKIRTVADLRVFVEFFEAILDYHASLDKSENQN